MLVVFYDSFMKHVLHACFFKQTQPLCCISPSNGNDYVIDLLVTSQYEILPDIEYEEIPATNSAVAPHSSSLEQIHTWPEFRHLAHDKLSDLFKQEHGRVSATCTMRYDRLSNMYIMRYNRVSDMCTMRYDRASDMYTTSYDRVSDMCTI